MKVFPIFISLASLLILSASCSRQLSSTNSTSQLKTASAPENKQEKTQAQSVHQSTKSESPISLVENTGTVCPADSKSSSSLKKASGKHKAIQNKVNTIRSLVSNQVMDLTISHKYVSERGYPQINKAGLIFIAAAILGYFLHLILIACIIIGVIGLFVLLSPLFRKRY